MLQLGQARSGKEVTLTSVSKIWNGTRAVDGISIDIAPGSFTALLGPSGCGKSTTLRMIAGLETVDEGTVEIGGDDVTAKPSAQRNIAMVFQSYALFPHLSVAENILFGLKVRRVQKAEREERLKRVADLLGLSALLDRKPAQLSGGQQQRVALGRAIIGEKPVCLMDEPLSNLDAKLRHEMRLEIRSLQQKLGFSMIYVTHDQVEAITMADQVVLLNEGRIEQAADPRTLYEKPASPFAARFIGTPPMNLFPARAFTDAAEAGKLLLGLRPENAFLDEAGPLHLTVQAVEYLGADLLVDGQLHGTGFQVRLPAAHSVAPGATIRLGFKTGHLHVFDQAAGTRRDDLVPEIGALMCS